MGEKGAFIGPVTWEGHFQALRESMAETFKVKPGSPVAVRVLSLLRELVKLLPTILEEEGTRHDFLDPAPGEFFSFIVRRPVPWDWDSMTPLLEDEELVSAVSVVGEDGIPPMQFHGARPTDIQEAASYAAISKGLAWFITGGMRGPALFHGLKGLTPFPEENPPSIEGTGGRVQLARKVQWGLQDMDLAESIAKGLGGSIEEVLGSVVIHGPILPWTLSLGGEAPLSAPKEFPFDDDLTKLLQSETWGWKGLRFKGETRGHAWESRFTITCRGLEVNQDTREVCFALDITPTWGRVWLGEDEWWNLHHQGQGTTQEGRQAAMAEWSTFRDNLVEEAQSMRTAAMGWGPEDWTSWAATVSSSITEAMDRLSGKVVDLKATLAGSARFTVSGSASLSTEDPSPTAFVAGTAAGSLGSFGGSGEGTVSTYGVEEVEPMVATFVPGEGFLSVRGGHQIRFLHKPAPDFSKVKVLEAVLDDRLKEGEAIIEATGETPSWMEENTKRKRDGEPWRLKKTEVSRIREELARSPHGVAEYGRGVETRWVRIFEDAKGKKWEFSLGGPWKFLNEGLLRKNLKVLEKEDEELAQKEEELETQSKAMLFPLNKDEQERVRRRRDLNEVRREALTSWGRAIKVLGLLQKQTSTQRQETIEVDADTFKLWIWGAEEAPENWLATIRETLKLLVNISATIEGVTLGGGSSLISWEYRTKDAPEKGQDAARYAKGSNLIFFITLNRILLGGLVLLSSTPKTLATGVQTPTFDTSEKKRREKKKEIEGMGDRLAHSPEVHLDHFLEVLGESQEVQTLGLVLANHVTAAGAPVAKGWTTKPKGQKNPDGSKERHYITQFCPLIPDGTFFHGALGHFTQSPEGGWKMAGKHNETRRTNYSLLEFMGIELPGGNAQERRDEATLQGFRALRRVVVDLGEGLLAIRLGGKWHDLGAPMEEAKLLHLLREGRIFPFFSPGWLDRIRAAYEVKARVKLPKSAEEAHAARWKKPKADEDGFPFTVRFQAALERRNLTQAQAAAELGVSKMTVSRWIRGMAISQESAAKVREWMDKDREG